MFALDGVVSTDTTWMAPAAGTAAAFGQASIFYGWTEGDFKALAAVANDPTEDELEDLALIDGFFKGSPAYTDGSTIVREGWTNPQTKRLSLRAMCGGKPDMQSNYPGSDAERDAWQFAKKYAANPFFCAPAQNIPKPRTMSFFLQPFWGLAKYFDINPELPWEEVKPVVLRAIAMLEALMDYPFPSPIDIRPQYWYQAAQSDINKFIRQDIVITKPLARLWVTCSLVNEGPTGIASLSAYIMHDMERDARHRARIEIVQKVAMAATFAVLTLGLGYALAPLIAPLVSAGIPITTEAVSGAVISGVQKALTAKEAKDAAETMDKVGKLFEVDNAAFAQEAYKVRDTFNYMGEAMSDLTDEQKAAIDQVKSSPEYSSSEVGEQYDVEPSSWPTQKKILIGGGIAAAVAAGLAIAFLR